MLRKLKIFYSGAFYHLLLASKKSRQLFRTPQDYAYFFDLLATVVDKYGCKIHLYALHRHAVHLLLQVGATEPSQIIQLLSNCYTRYFNKKYRVLGSLFTGRYKAKLILEPGYFAELCHFLHGGEVSSQSVVTSRRAYCGEVQVAWLTQHPVLNELAARFGASCNYLALEAVWQTQHVHYVHLEFLQGALMLCNRVNQRICTRSSIAVDFLHWREVRQLIAAELPRFFKRQRLVDSVDFVLLQKVLVVYFCQQYLGDDPSKIATCLETPLEDIELTFLQYCGCTTRAALLRSAVATIEKALLCTLLDR